MKNKKIIILFFTLICIILFTMPIYASSVLKNIEVAVNNISLFVNDNQITVDNFVYDGTTYVPVRAVAKTLGLSVDWDSKANRVDLRKDLSITLNKNTDGKYVIDNRAMHMAIFESYYLWNYLDIAFTKNIRLLDSSFEAYLTDMLGNRITTEYAKGDSKFQNLLVIPKEELQLNTYYSLYIPKNKIAMENGDLYSEDILIQFKTPTNVIKGKISSSTNLYGKQITIQSSDKDYTATILGNNEFVFTNIIPDNYNVFVNGRSQGNIIVEDNKINNTTIYETQKDNN